MKKLRVGVLYTPIEDICFKLEQRLADQFVNGFE